MVPDEQAVQGDELAPGSTLCGGQYTIDRYLSAGGFGVTYLACDSLGRRVVIKECFPSAMCFRSNQTVCVRSQGNAVEFDAILELFEKEARALASLQHPYIVGVHQYFRDNGTAYMAMDFVEGQTLLDIIENEPQRLTPDMVKTLLSQLLQAISYIHRHDILHRDISPDNILIDDDNLPVLIDFGAAREDATRVSRVLSKVLTVKDGYSPQEFYLAGSDQVYASDLYALAATFFHVVTGTAPPSSHTRMAAAARDAKDPMPELGRIEGYDPGFVAAISRCLNLFAKDRLQSASAWQEAIDADLRKQKLLLEAEQDRALDRTIARLVKDFFKDFQPRSHPGVNSMPESPAAPEAIAPVATALPEDMAGPDPAPVDAPERTELTPEDTDLAEAEADEMLSEAGLDAAEAPPAEGADRALDIRPRRPVLPPKPDAEPALAPIEKMQMKYSAPPAPEEAPAPDAVRRGGWLSRFSRAKTPDRHSPTNGGSSEEIA